MRTVRKYIVFSLLILALLARGIVPVGFMPAMSGMKMSKGSAMIECPGMAGMADDQSADHSKSHKPCVYAAEFVTAKAADAPVLPLPRWKNTAVRIFKAGKRVPARSVSFYDSRGPPEIFLL